MSMKRFLDKLVMAGLTSIFAGVMVYAGVSFMGSKHEEAMRKIHYNEMRINTIVEKMSTMTTYMQNIHDYIIFNKKPKDK